MLPNTSDKVQNVAEYEGGGAGNGLFGGVTPVSVTTPDPALNPTDGSWEDGTRTMPQYCDTYETNDYIYCFGAIWDSYNSNGVSESWVGPGLNGWSVNVKDKTKTSYEPIFESINGEPVTNMYGTFESCTSLTTAPTIPNSVINMKFAFCLCASLKTYIGSTDADGDFSNYIIPNSVLDMYYTFSGCTSLTATPTIQGGVTNMEGAFLNCKSLSSISSLPDSLLNMKETFRGCILLTDLSSVSIPSGVTDMRYTFQGCTSLVLPPVLPNNVEKISEIFWDCTSLTTAPSLPNVYSIMNVFRNCPALKTYVGSTDPDGDFSNYIIPSSVTDMQNAFSSCTSITTAPVIPNSVKNLISTFANCTSLFGTIEVNAIISPCGSSPNYYIQKCLFNTNITTVTGSTNKKTELLNTKTQGGGQYLPAAP